MWNIVFIDVNKLNVNYESPESAETLKGLETLKNNILKLVGNEDTLIVFVADGDKLENARFDAALLINYFNTATLDMGNIVIGNLLTDDAIADLCVRSNASTHFTDSPDPVPIKQLDTITAIGKENISKVVHITNGVEYFFLQRIANLANISMATGYDYPNGNIDQDTVNGRNILYLVSKEPGIAGFNDCFDTYFRHKEDIQIRSKKKPENE